MNDYSITKITDAASEPITLEKAKQHLNIADDVTAFDDYIGGLITAARLAVEKEIHRPIGEQVYELGLRMWPTVIRFPFPPLLDVKKISYRAVGEDAFTVLLDTGAQPPVPYAAVLWDTSGDPGELWLRPTAVWPATVLDQGFPIRIRYTAGIVAPSRALIQAILMLLGTWFENRESVAIGRANQGYEVPNSMKWLCEQDTFEEFS